MATILIIDDEKKVRDSLKEILTFEGYKVDMATDGEEAINLMSAKKYDCALCDVKMPKKDGLEVLTEIQKRQIETPVVMISGHGNMETAVDAVKKGAYDFIEKPPDLNRLLITIRNAIDRSILVEDNQKLKKKTEGLQDIIGESDAIQEIKKTIERVGPTDARVLITGENGSGKELVARWLHHYSARSKSPLIEVNCAAIPSELIDSELFGHEKGSFTSAVKQHIGKFEQANGGTLFMDEIGDMSLSAQAKVLRALQEGKITRVGGEKDIAVNVRVIAATNKNLLEEIDKGEFRLDLYHRLNVINIKVPSLNERIDDIPLLSTHFIEQICESYKMKKTVFDTSAFEALKMHNWTGNIRELRNIVERLIILSDGKVNGETVKKLI